MSGPLVSILIPTHNGERFLRAALRSALDQSHREIEVVVGDDASTDRTPEILAEVAAADPRVRVLRHERNVRAYDNTLRLIEAARGEYLKFLLHDDVLARDCVKELLRGMQAADDVSLAFSHRSFIGEDGRPLPAQPPPLGDRPGVIDGTVLGDLVLETCRNVIGEMSTVLFRRRDVLDPDLWELDGRRLTANGDVYLWLQLLGRGNAYYTPQTLSRFRMHGAQSSRDPQVVAAGARDWPLLIDWGHRHGFLADAGRQRRGYAEVVTMAAAVLGQVVGTPLQGAPLEALHLATARLVELDAAPEGGVDAPLPSRAHGTPLLQRFTQELDVWSRPRPLALAAPRPDAGEVDATVAALREVAATGAAEQLVLAVPEADVPRVVELVEAALTGGPDLDVDLVPAEDPAAALTVPWLAVAPHGSTWHRGRADAVWTFAVPADGG